MGMKKSIIIRTVIMAVLYSAVILIMGNDYSSDNLIKVGIQGIVFAIVFGVAVREFYLANNCPISLKALNSSAFPAGSKKNMVACSPTCPSKRI